MASVTVLVTGTLSGVAIPAASRSPPTTAEASVRSGNVLRTHTAFGPTSISTPAITRASPSSVPRTFGSTDQSNVARTPAITCVPSAGKPATSE
jgi:hypothetical protein